MALFDALLQAFPPSATHADAAPARQRTTAIPSTPTTTKSSTSEDEEAAAKAAENAAQRGISPGGPAPVTRVYKKSPRS